MTGRTSVVGRIRTQKANKHAAYSLLLKLVGIASTMALVPVALDSLDAERYGVWLTLSSVVTWLTFFDVGIGNGLRNRLSEALARGDVSLARTYISTSYVAVLAIMVFVGVAFGVVSFRLDWREIVNVVGVTNEELRDVAQIVFYLFAVRFVLQLVSVVLLADQKAGGAAVFDPVASLISLIVLFIMSRESGVSLSGFSLITGMSPIIVLGGSTLILYYGAYRDIAPSLRYVKFSKLRDITSLGFRFFYSQIAFILFFSTGSVLVAHYGGSGDVVEYNIAYRYLFVANMAFTIYAAPFWSAVTEAYVRQDYEWLWGSLRRLCKVSYAVSCFVIVLLVLSDEVYALWLGSRIDVRHSLSAALAAYFVIQALIVPYTTFINGLGKLKVSIRTITIQLFVFVPSVYLLGEKYGAVGVVLAMLVTHIPSLVVESIQVNKILSGKAKGIWDE